MQYRLASKAIDRHIAVHKRSLLRHHLLPKARAWTVLHLVMMPAADAKISQELRDRDSLHEGGLGHEGGQNGSVTKRHAVADDQHVL